MPFENQNKWISKVDFQIVTDGKRKNPNQFHSNHEGQVNNLSL